MNLKYFWINIDNSIDRKEYMENQFNNYKIDNIRISATTPSNLSDFIEDKEPYFCGNSCCLNNGCKDCIYEYCCSCSHLNAIKEGYKSGDNFFIICEDDIYLPFTINFQKLINEMPNDFEILQMMVLDYEGNKFINSLYKNNKFYIKFDESKRLFSTGMYLITRKGASKLLKLFTNKQTGKYDFRNINCFKQADYILYLNANTYTLTYPYCYPNLKFVSQIHPYHYYYHKLAIDLMKQVIYDKTIDNPFINNLNIKDDYDYSYDFYWINLDNAIERKIFMENQFNKFKINNYRISAYSPKDLNEILEDKPPYNCGYPECIQNGCIDCPIEYSVICSHLKAIKTGYESGKNFFIVCEDDIELPFLVNFHRLYAVIVSNNIDIVQMMVISEGHTEYFYNNYYKSNHYLVNYNPITPSAGYYLCTREGAKKLLDLYIDKETGKFNFKNCNYLKLADVLLFQSVNTVVSTMPFAIPNINFKSQIHTHHYEAHKKAHYKIKEIIEKNNNTNPFIYQTDEVENLFKS